MDDKPVRPETQEPTPTLISNPEPPTVKSAPEQDTSTRARETMLKLIISLAVSGYGYDPRKRRSEEPGLIAADLEALGIPVTAETVRKYLDEGAKLLSPNALKNRFGDD